MTGIQFAVESFEDALDPPAHQVELLREQLSFVAGFTEGPKSSAIQEFNPAQVLESYARFLRDHPYDVVRSGEDVVEVPLIGASCPAVEDSVIKASLAYTKENERAISFKLYGTEFGRGVKATTTNKLEFDCAPGQSNAAYIIVPVHWEIREVPNQSILKPWLSVSPKLIYGNYDGGIGPTAPPGPDQHPPAQERHRITVADGIPPVTNTIEHNITETANYGVGLTKDHFEASITLTRTKSMTMSFGYTLAGGMRYMIDCFSGPPFGRVSAESF